MPKYMIILEKIAVSDDIITNRITLIYAWKPIWNVFNEWIVPIL